MKKQHILIFSLLAMTVIFSGCVDEATGSAIVNSAIVCNDPYIRLGTGCCLDADNNNICDKDEEEGLTEGQETNEPKESVETTKCHAAHDSFPEPIVDIWFEDENENIIYGGITAEPDEEVQYNILLKAFSGNTLVCDGKEFYNGELHQEFEANANSIGNPLSAYVEPLGKEGTTIVSYTLTCYNLAEYQYKDTCDSIKSTTDYGYFKVFYVSSQGEEPSSGSSGSKGESGTIGEQVALNGDTVQVNYWLTVDGEQIDTSEGRGPFEFTLGSGEVISGFNDAVLGMKVGENKDVVLTGDDAYISGPLEGKELHFKIELLAIL